MQVEYYEPTRRDKLRSEAFAQTEAGKAARKRRQAEMFRILEWKMNKGFVPDESTLRDYNEWKSKRSES